MRVLVTSCPAASHFYPVVPFALALQRAGHHVLVATGGRFAPRAAASGLAVHPAGGDIDLLSVTPAGTQAGWGRMVALAEQTAGDIVRLARDWQPDLLVRTPTEFAGPIVAELLGIPMIEHSFGLVMRRARLRDAEEVLVPLYRRYRVRPQLSSPTAILDVCPPTFRPPDATVGTPMRYVPFHGTQGPTPREPEDVDVCLTLGTILPALGHTAVLTPVLAAASDLALRTTVLGIAPAELPGVNAQDWLPLDRVLSRCRVLAHHGGSGTTFAALAAGVPQLVMPHMTDQPDNAARIEATGVGRSIRPDQMSRQAARTALAQLMSDGEERAAARVLQAEVQALPSPDTVVARLGHLCRSTAGSPER
jgi:L-noviosyl transferase